MPIPWPRWRRPSAERRECPPGLDSASSEDVLDRDLNGLSVDTEEAHRDVGVEVSLLAGHLLSDHRADCRRQLEPVSGKSIRHPETFQAGRPHHRMDVLAVDRVE